ncbi:hypothetical protein DFR50_14152 [Roseiarcus fermentans]|uniref:Uncharacterized protein n=1 Tax=Roseiarcus fermentans TaxID=1473586 RepID=A0A366EQX0_9HYPH|nr:hypothetical protein [Roseiarcus fermentans]RBP04080.1 hypothetical protein DFR50_14152 [Roseiarcus fermentans]
MSQRLTPTLDELLRDSLIQAVMRADNVEPQALRTLFSETAGRIAARREGESKAASVFFSRPPIDRRAPPRLLAPPSRMRPAQAPGPCGSAICC